MKLEIRHLRHFNAELKRDILTDALGRPHRASDESLLIQVVTYGNSFLERYRTTAEDDNCVAWYDVNFGEPAQVGLTWALNPLAPLDTSTGMDFFFRTWSEIPAIADGELVLTLEQCQRDFAAYALQNITS